jgi:hypothetical protein
MRSSGGALSEINTPFGQADQMTEAHRTPV